MPDADQSFVRWLHIPKAGSAYVNNVVSFARVSYHNGSTRPQAHAALQAAFISFDRGA